MLGTGKHTDGSPDADSLTRLWGAEFVLSNHIDAMNRTATAIRNLAATIVKARQPA